MKSLTECHSKWPQMIVTGKSVTIEQAKEIIFLTDYFLTDCYQYSGGNNKKFNEEYRIKSGLEDIRKKYDSNTLWNIADKIRSELGCFELEYIKNDYASSSFFNGPHGWCNPDGKIYFVDNVGPWPTIKKLFSEWELIATRFNFLDINISIMSNERFHEFVYNKPIINFKVCNGKVELTEGDLSVHDIDREEISDVTKLNYGPLCEIGLPLDWYDEYANKIKNYLIARKL
jgi:hypothetical protein